METETPDHCRASDLLGKRVPLTQVTTRRKLNHSPFRSLMVATTFRLPDTLCCKWQTSWIPFVGFSWPAPWAGATNKQNEGPDGTEEEDRKD